MRETIKLRRPVRIRSPKCDGIPLEAVAIGIERIDGVNNIYTLYSRTMLNKNNPRYKMVNWIISPQLGLVFLCRSTPKI